MYNTSALHSLIYRSFLAIPDKDYYGLIHFFEEKEDAIDQLEDHERHHIVIDYVQALFEIGAYQQFLGIVDEAILIVLDTSSVYDEIKGMAIFHQLLFRKAAAWLQTGHYRKSSPHH
ncbi:MAG: hypothetical protein R2795_24965 [Saprospiraceae bacterium]